MAKNSGLQLDDGIAEFGAHLAQRPLAENTRKAFLGDARIFARFLQSASGGPELRPIPLATITTEQIKSFLAAQERGAIANSPKSIERRLTSLKVFFKWLQEAGFITVDPADGVAYKPFMDPLPEYLTEQHAQGVIDAARRVATGERLEMRPLTSIMLVLDTGIKKGECLALSVDDVERDDQGHAGVWVRYTQRHLRFKDRKLPVSDECLQVVDSHIQRYEVTDKLFDCTGRNLEYMFNRKVAPLANLPALTFEMLRWTCAVRDYTAGQLTNDQLQTKYGLSSIGWLEMEAKLARLTRPSYDTGKTEDNE
ncbi:MAG TPA: site-specific integrase [Anaerolineae bacterium]